MIHNFVGRLLLENIYEQICMKNVWWGRGSGEAKSPRNTVVVLYVKLHTEVIQQAVDFVLYIYEV
jgi:hypothetical protein